MGGPTDFFEVLFTPDEVSSITPLKKMSTPPIIPHDNDVLMGRGGKNNQHIGNEKLRNLARQRCDNYRHSSKKGKSYISRELVKLVRGMSPPGRFLKKNSISGLWHDVGDEVAREKASQALRDAVSALMANPSNASPEQLDQSMTTISQEHRRSSSDPSIPMSRGKRVRHREAPTPAYSSAEFMPTAAYSTPHDYPPVTPASATSAKRRRYVPPSTPHELSSLPIPGSPIRMPDERATRPAPQARYPAQHSNADPNFDSPGDILSAVQPPESSEFDLFNGELLEDQGDPRADDSPGLRSDTF